MNNAGFELGLADWNTFNGEATITSDAFAGNNALALSTARSGIDQGFSVIAGESYTLSGYGKTTDSSWNGMGLSFYDQNWTLLEKTSTRITSEDWAEYTLDAIAPTGAANGILWAWKGGDSGITVLDELTVSGSTPPPPPPPPLPPTEGELLTNPGFESSLSGWNSFKGSETTTTTDPFEGNSALQLSENGSGISQALDIIGGETYQLSGYGKYTGDLRSGLGIDFWDASWTKIEGYSTQITGADWQLYEITQEAPVNAAHATIWSWKGGNSGSAFLDALSVQIIDEPTPNQAPIITSNGGATSATLSLAENITDITNIEATDADGDTEGNGLTYSLDGPDINQISIDPNTGQLSFNRAPDFESPTDANQDNTYDVTVVVTDSQGAQDSQQLDIAISDVNANISFNQIGAFKGLEGGADVVSNPTSIQFGPDGRLYVSEQNGTINAFTVTLQNGKYSATGLEEINLVKEIQNHNDDGTLSSSENRQVTGILATGTATTPILYVSSSDPRIAVNGDVNLDTNSGVITRLTRNGNTWDAVDIVRGLPRSEENHSNNGLVLSPDGTKLYVAVGGNTNNGAPSSFFSYTGEYALSGTVLEIDLVDLNSRPILTDNAPGQNGRQYVYDLLTLDDPTIPNITDGVGEDEFGLDEAGPWGGNDGFNMAILTADAPLRIYADGFRNHYDLVMTPEGLLYTVDNGSNGNLGGNPITDGAGQATNKPNNGGTGDPEPLFLIEDGGYYGHPNPARSNQTLAWTVYDNSGNPDTSLSPNSVLSLADLVPASANIQDGFIIDPSKFTADPARLLESGIRVERDSPESNALITVGSSSNGLVEYSGDAFGGELNGDLLVAQFNGNIGRLDLNATGTAATYEPISGLSGLSVLLDVTLGPNGTIWATEIGGDFIKVFAPSDLVIPDDPDADDDGILNVNDPFIRDASNGASAVVIPGQTLLWDFDANQDDNLPGPDGYGGGLTGVMIDGTIDFEEFFQEPSLLPGQDIKLDNVKFITAAGGGTTVIETVSSGDPLGTANSGEYLFHTGVTIAPTVDTFTIKWSVFNPGSDLAEAFQQIGGYIGTGNQSDYLKLVAVQGNSGEIELLLEDGDVVQSQSFIQADDLFDVPANSKIFFELTVDPDAATATPTITYETATGNKVVTGAAISLAGTAVLDAIQGNYTVNGQTTGLAVGLFSSNNGALPQPDFQAIFDDIEITATGNTASTVLYRVNAGGEAIASLDGGPDWAADPTSNPSPFLSDPGSNSSASFPLLDPGSTVPLNIPGTIFDTERWEEAGGPEMQWAFSVPTNGLYEVRLFMGNGWSGTNDPGERVFDVAIEGTVLNTLNDVDLTAQFGHEVGGLISNIVPVTDGVLNLEFLHVVQNPLINGIEILQIGD